MYIKKHWSVFTLYFLLNELEGSRVSRRDRTRPILGTLFSPAGPEGCLLWLHKCQWKTCVFIWNFLSHPRKYNNTGNICLSALTPYCENKSCWDVRHVWRMCHSLLHDHSIFLWQRLRLGWVFTVSGSCHHTYLFNCFPNFAFQSAVRAEILRTQSLLRAPPAHIPLGKAS